MKISHFGFRPANLPRVPALAHLPVTEVRGPWHLCEQDPQNENWYLPNDEIAAQEGKNLNAAGIKRVIIEIEPSAGPPGRWDLGAGHPDDVFAASVTNYENVMRGLRATYSGEIGLYNFPCHHGSWARARDMWQPDKYPWWLERTMFAWSLFAKHVAVLNPSCYAYESREQEQAQSVSIMLAMSRLLGAVVAPVVWYRRQTQTVWRGEEKWTPLRPLEFAVGSLLPCRAMADEVLVYSSTSNTAEEDSGPWIDPLLWLEKNVLE